MPDQVERFRLGYVGAGQKSLQPAPSGEWVRYSDYEKLKEQCERWKQDNLRMTAEHDRLDNEIGPLRRAIADSEELTEAVRGALATARDERDQARKQRDEELRERALGAPAQEAGRLALMRGNADDATVAERVETITRAILDTIYEEADSGEHGLDRDAGGVSPDLKADLAAYNQRAVDDVGRYGDEWPYPDEDPPDPL